MTINIWVLLGIASVVLLAIYFKRKRNSLWGGLTIGAIIGFVIALFSGFNWFAVGKGAVVGTLAGFIAELLEKLSKRN